MAYWLLVIILGVASNVFCSSASSLHEEDADSLRSFLSQVSMPYRNSSIQGWTDASQPSCNWSGIVCNKNGRISAINFSRFGLVGEISNDIGKLSFLEILNLSTNNLSGTIPSQLSCCFQLKVLDLSGNHLSGSIPPSLSSLSKLQYLSFSHNKLSNTIPPSLSNCTSLTILALAENHLSGPIPSEFGMLSNLQRIFLYNNSLEGTIPKSMLTNCTNLKGLYLSFNNLSGYIPSEIGRLENLEQLWLNNNKLDGPIPSDIGNLSNLVLLDLSSNRLEGSIPGSLGKLVNLSWALLLHQNFLTGSFPIELTTLTKLTQLYLNDNMLRGPLPPEIGRMNLTGLFLRNNNFSGQIPVELYNLRFLQTLQLQNNKFEGEISPQIGSLQILSSLYLQDNHLSGSIPESLADCKQLVDLSLASNLLSGEIPPRVAGMRTIGKNYNLSHNYLTGKLPDELGLMEQVNSIDLSYNNFSGRIPVALQGCVQLISLNVSHNHLYGGIPQALSNLQSLVTLDLSHNNLSGSIPVFLGQMKTLAFLDISYNDFHGSIPQFGVFRSLPASSFLGNLHLCGTPLPIKCLNASSQKNYHASSLLGVKIGLPVAFCIGIVFLFAWSLRRKKKIYQGVSIDSLNLPKFTLEELKAATKNFSTENIIGYGGCSKVYRGSVSNNIPVAVKLMQQNDKEEEEEVKFLNHFLAEVQALGNTKHRNLVNIVGYCADGNTRALVTQLMDNGSLEDHLHSYRTGFDWETIYSISIGIVHGLVYLHHESAEPIIHCDLKPSNILLDADMIPHLADFGLARLLGSADLKKGVTASGLRGTIGYTPPEYAFGGRITPKVDVYSFGILLLEMLTRMRPTDNRFEQGINISKWVDSFDDKTSVIDPQLLRNSGNRLDEILALISVALSCCKDNPNDRPGMRVVRNMLSDIQRHSRDIKINYPNWETLLDSPTYEACPIVYS